MKANRLVLLAAAGASMLVLSGCAQSGNVAARVGDVTVPTSDVDFLTRVQCDAIDKQAKAGAQSAQGAKIVPVSLVRTGMVNTLVQSELNRQLATSKHLTYDKTTLSGVMQQFESLVAAAPAKDRDRFRSMVEDVYRGQLQIYSLAQSQLADQGVAKPTQDQVSKAVDDIQAKFRKSVDIKVNPQYGADDNGVAGAVDPSLSRAVSSFAKQSRSAQPDPTWVAQLPDDQRCG